MSAVVDDLFVALWVRAARGAGWVFGVRAGPWRPAGGPVAVVAPHPDDEVIGCAGAIRAHRQAGDRVVILYVTDGRSSRAFPGAPDVVACVRHEEAHDATSALGAEMDWLGLRESDATAIGGMSTLMAERIAALRPTVIYAPSWVDFHPVHRAVALALAGALSAAGQDTTIRVYQVQVPLSTLANMAYPIPRDPAIQAAIRSYRSQAGTIASTLRLKRYAGALLGRRGEVEAFWQLTAQAYCAVHKHPSARSEIGFRGIRRHALTDPLAFFLGQRARKMLARLAAAP